MNTTDFYFAYGSNLNETDWNQGDRPRFNEVFDFVSRAWLTDHDLGFTYKSPSRNGGVLDVVASVGKCVPGVVFRIRSSEGWDALDRKEGAPYYYQRRETQVLAENGEQLNVVVYQVCSEELEKSGDRENSYVQPQPDYVEAVRTGLREYGFSGTQLDAAAARTETPHVDSFFCYGTLRKGDCRYGVMQKFKILSERPGMVSGRLYDCGSYPGIKLGRRGAVYGELIRVCDWKTALRELDQIEGYHSADKARSLFCREYTPVRLSDAPAQIAWIYELAGKPRGPAIQSGDWLKER